MGISPRIPLIVLRTCKPKPTDHARETFKGLANTRTVSPSVHSRSSSEGSVSFFLASALSDFTNRPCSLPVEKTRNASNRSLPPKRLACTRTSWAPSLAPHFRMGSSSQSLRLCAVLLGDWAVHGRSFYPLRRIVFTLPHPVCVGRRTRARWSHDRLRHERRLFSPTVLMRSSLWQSCRELLWFILRLTHLRECCVCLGRVFRLSRWWELRELTRVGGCGDHQDHSYRLLVKDDASLWSGMPSTVRDSS